MSEEGITLTAESFKVHAREQVSTGDYENANVSVTIEGNIHRKGKKPVDATDPERAEAIAVSQPELDDDVRVELEAELLDLLKRAQHRVNQAAENRLRIPDDEDWSL